MNFLSKNRIPVLFAGAIIFLVAAVFWPESKKSGELQKYYSLPAQQLVRLAYSGEMSLTDKIKVRVEYTIRREENILNPKEPLYPIEITALTGTDAKIAARIVELLKVRRFYASALVRTIVQDWSEPDFYFILKHEAERDAEYGLKDCSNRLSLEFKSTRKQFCIGMANKSDTRRYVLDTEKDKTVVMPDFSVRRLVNNIFAQREQSLYPHGASGADLAEIKVENELLKKFPLLREKTAGVLKLRMLVKDDAKGKTNVWHVENLLSIKPSHAAEFAGLLSALRIHAPFATEALHTDATLAQVMANSGFDAKVQPVLTGAVKLKKTDKQDALLTAFAFFPPGVKPARQPAYQLENQLTRPLDSVVLSHFNAGYITADLYPRLLSMLQKFEGDLTEAQKKGEQEKAEREKKEKEKTSKPGSAKP